MFKRGRNKNSYQQNKGCLNNCKEIRKRDSARREQDLSLLVKNLRKLSWKELI